MKKKVLFLIYSLAGGGAEKVLVDTVNHLNQEKYEITLQTLFHDTTHYERLLPHVHYKTIVRAQNRAVRKLLSGMLQYVIPPKLVYRWFLKGDYDVECAALEGISTKLLAYSDNQRARHYAWVHTDMTTHLGQDRLYRSLALHRWCYERFDGIYCVSEGIRETVLQKFDLSRERVHVLYNVLDEEEIGTKQKEPCHGFSEQGWKLVSVGTLNRWKGFDRLIRVCGRLKREGFRFQLAILGEGTERKRLEALIAACGVADQVSLGGYAANPYPLMAASDLYVCSSRLEGFSTVVSEAIVVGTPVLTTEVPGMRELLGDSEYGLIVPNSEEGLYQGLCRMLGDREIYSHYRRKTGERSGFFSMSERIRAFEEVLDQT